MKLRLQSNSVRLRLKRSEVERLIKNGRVEERIVFGDGEGDVLRYILEISLKISTPKASYRSQVVLVQVPAEMAIRWARGDDIGIETVQAKGSQDLHVIIEKDFACLNGPEEQNVDTYPNPAVGEKCPASRV
jgi:hypothetical protein